MPLCTEAEKATRFFCESLRHNPEEIEPILQMFKSHESLFNAEFWDNVLEALPSDLLIYKEEIRYLSLIRRSSSQIDALPPQLQDNKAFFYIATYWNGCAIQEASERLINDSDLAYRAVSNNGMALCYLSCLLKNEDEIVKKAIETHPASIEFASDELKVKYAFAAVSARGMTLEVLDKENKELVLEAMRNNGMALRCVGEALRDDEDVVNAAIENNIEAIQFASERLKRDFSKLILSVDPMMLKHLDGNNKELVLQAVQKNGLALKFAHYSLKSDLEVAVAAVDNDSKALYFVASALKETSAFKDKKYPELPPEDIALLGGLKASTLFRVNPLASTFFRELRERASSALVGVGLSH